MKRNGETVEYQVTLNIPDLRKKINKTCANRPVSCVNGENPSDFGFDKETVYHCAAALGRRACPLRHRLRDATSPKGRGTGVPVRPTRDEQSLIFSETGVLRCLDSRQLDKGYCPEAAALCSKARPFASYRASGVQ